MSSAKWTLMAEAVTRGVPAITFVMLARILAPEDFGLVAIAMMIVTLSTTVWDAGLSKALVQTSDSSDDVPNIVFWANTALAIVVASAVVLLAPVIAAFFGSAALTPILRALVAVVLLQASGSVHQAMFMRQFGFRAVFVIRAAGSVAPALVSIPLALAGYGPWSLVVGTLLGQSVAVALTWKMSGWRPRTDVDWSKARGLTVFGAWVFAEAVLAWVVSWGDSLALGRFFGARDVGVYRTGWTIGYLAFSLTLTPFYGLLFSALSRLQDDHVRLRSTFRKANRLSAAICVSVGVGLWLIGPLLEKAVFGSRWPQLGRAIGYLALAQAAGWLVGGNAELYRATGRPDINAKALLLTVAVYVPVFVWAAQEGLGTLMVGRFVLALSAIPIHVGLAAMVLRISPMYVIQDTWPALAAAAVMVLSVKLVSLIVPAQSGPQIALVVATGIGAASFIAAFSLFRPASANEILSLARRSVRRAPRDVR